MFTHQNKIISNKHSNKYVTSNNSMYQYGDNLTPQPHVDSQ